MFRRPVRALLAAASAAVVATLSLAPVAGAGIHRHGGAFPVTVPSTYGPVTLAHAPRRIISLSPTATEMLFAIGAGRQVNAVDNDSNYPATAPHTSLSGYTPNVEAIAARNPDLVVISYNPKPPNLVQALRLLHVPVYYLPAASTLAQSYSEIATLGALTGQRSGAARLVASMRSGVAHLLARLPRPRLHPTYFYELGASPLYTATADTFVGSVLALAGFRNIAGASVHGSDYPEFSNEAVVRANPDFIFLTDGTSVASVAKRPGWSALSAVRAHHVIALNPDIASRWGPRIVDLLRTVVSALTSAAGSGTAG